MALFRPPRGCRIPGTGRVDFGRALGFRFDGKPYRGYAGDTLATALLSNGVLLTGRSFKYHRPRGIHAAGPEEANALVTLREGRNRVPNLPASEIPLYEGLEAESQNRWPSLRHDFLSLNDRLGRFLAAGFYYKTFMGPTRRGWRFYEPWIRRAAGLGRLPETEDSDVYEQSHLFTEVLVAGSGPAGLAAASAAARDGARVALVESDFVLGGSFLREPGAGAQAQCRRRLVEALEAAENVRIFTRTTCFGAYDGLCFGLVERAPHPGEAFSGAGAAGADGASFPPSEVRQRFWTVRAEQAILATGASERPLVFSGNDAPGVVSASSARAWLNRWGVLPTSREAHPSSGARIAVAGTHDGAWETACDLARVGINVGARVILADARERGAQAPYLVRAAEGLGISVHYGHVPLGVRVSHGGTRLRGVVLAPWDEEAGAAGAGAHKRIPCDLLCTSGGFSPNLHLLGQRGHPVSYDERLAAFVPARPLPPGWTLAGAAGGETGGAPSAFFAGGLRAALASGLAAGASARKRLKDSAGAAPFGPPPSLSDPESLTELDDTYSPPRGPHDDNGPRRDARANLAIWLVRTKAQKDSGQVPRKAFVDLQGDVTADDIALSHREGFGSAEHLKRYTTIGMGTDQGKGGALNALGILAETRGVPVGALRPTTYRAPYSPVGLGAIAGRNAGRLFRPVRRTPLHDSALREEVRWVEAGPWLRARYFPRSAEDTLEHASQREAAAVRGSVGVSDISTLGKILVQGRDAAEFLERAYLNGWRDLATGRVRYCLMLRDDGLAADDGTGTRLSENAFLMTTSSGHAAEVLARLEFLAQAAHPELDVECTDLGDAWAMAAVAGPRSRALLSALFPESDLSGGSLPYMGALEASFGGTDCRIHRVSFSGELGYEVLVPSELGARLWRALRAGVPDPDGGGGNGEGEEEPRLRAIPYGLEAMDILRIEKGFIAGGELDGRATAGDLGLGAMLERAERRAARGGAAAAGLVLAQRPGLRDEAGRPSLVGLRAERGGRVTAGALLFAEEGALRGHGLGWVSSSCFSPRCGGWIGLGFLRHGEERQGSLVRLADPTGGGTSFARVTPPRFYDPSGERARG